MKRRKICNQIPKRKVAEKRSVPSGIRTPAAAVKGRCPRPLDEGDKVHSEITYQTNTDEPGWIRTSDPYIKSVLLYQLSYEPLESTRRRVLP